jgi:prepilin-type N-terminal cleavage/methylation domain-containing protein
MRISRKKFCSHGSIGKGFTILELLVVSILMVVVMMITAQFWRWFSPCIADLIAREHLLREARLTMQSFAYDFGAASEISGGDQLLINSNIYYYRESSSDPNLYRRNYSEGTNFVIADCVSDFSVEENPPGSNLWEINMTLQARSYKNNQPFRRELIFHWSPPG